MPRGAKLTPEVENLITKVCVEHLEWLAKPSKVQQEVIRQLPEPLRMWGGPDWPGRAVIQNRIRNKIGPKIWSTPPESKRLDEPWSIGASVGHGIPPEASKDLFDIWRFSLALGRPISIRQAKWIVYIRKLFYRDISAGTEYSDKVRRNLWLIRQSWLYSILERVAAIEEREFDTTDLDAASFMPNWEHATALKLGKISSMDYSPDTLAKLEKQGVSLTSPSVNVGSVEQAVWHEVRSEPPPGFAYMVFDAVDEVLSEEEDMVCAYWLMYLSKGPRWNDLPPRPEVTRELRKRRRQREKGYCIPDSGGFPDDSLYSRQLSVRRKLIEWVKEHASMSIRDYQTLTAQHPALVLAPRLLATVGYEVPREDPRLSKEVQNERKHTTKKQK